MNSVNIIGFLREKIDSLYRNFEYELPYMIEGNKETPRLIIKFWTDQPNTRLSVLPPNTRVALHGHLDIDPKFGTILLVEQLEVIK